MIKEINLIGRNLLLESKGEQWRLFFDVFSKIFQRLYSHSSSSTDWMDSYFQYEKFVSKYHSTMEQNFRCRKKLLHQQVQNILKDRTITYYIYLGQDATNL